MCCRVIVLFVKCMGWMLLIQAIRERNIAYHIHSHLMLFIGSLQLYTSSCGSLGRCYCAGTGSRLGLLPEPVMTFDPEN